MDAFLVKPMSLAGLEEALARCGNTLATRSERDSVHLDRAAVERLGDELGDRAELVRIAGIYLEQLPDGVAAIAAAVETGDTPALRRAAHRLGASSATFGAAALAALCGRLERLGERGVTEGTEQLVRSVTRERELVAAELTRLLSGQRSGSTSSR
jgi:HPt (histidine-containing phosphotransfer) domain-containing protein